LAERHTFDGTTISDVLIVMFDNDKLICDRALGFKTSCFRTIPPYTWRRPMHHPLNPKDTHGRHRPRRSASLGPTRVHRFAQGLADPRNDPAIAVLDVNDGEDRETFELPGADLSGEKRTVRVFPRQADAFGCSSCFLVNRSLCHPGAARTLRSVARYAENWRCISRPVNAIAHKRD
jgi:hypothetical protein